MHEKPAAEADNPSCPICGYRLRGLPPAGRCPECGCAYDPRSLAAGSSRPPGGWAYLLSVPVAAALGVPGLSQLGPMGMLTTLICLVWCWHAGRRFATWRHELRVRAHRRDQRPLPPPQYRRLVQYVILAAALLILWCVHWALVP